MKNRLGSFFISLFVLSFFLTAPQQTQAQENLLVNGDFEAGLGGWEVVEVTPFVPDEGTPHYPIIGVKDGHGCPPSYDWTNHMYLDVPHGSDGYVQQTVTLSEEPITLSFITWGNFDPVTATVSIVTAEDGEQVLDSFTPPITEVEGGCSGNAPVEKSFDLSSYAGQEITLRFRATSNNGIGAFATFDDVTITAMTEECGLPTFTWQAGQGASYTNSSNWNPEGPPGEDALVRFDFNGFVPVTFNEDVTADAIEISAGEVELDLSEHFYNLSANSGCNPSLLITASNGNVSKLTVKNGGMNFLKEATIFEGDIILEDNAVW